MSKILEAYNEEHGTNYTSLEELYINNKEENIDYYNSQAILY